jgi:hypothetical protein
LGKAWRLRTSFFTLTDYSVKKVGLFVVFPLIAVVSKYSSPLNPAYNNVVSKNGLNLLLVLVENQKESRADPITF